MTENTDGFDEGQFEKPILRAEIREKRKQYLAEGGKIHKFIPPFKVDYFVECDIFIEGVGSFASDTGLKDTKVRKPRPEKKFGKK
jgi:hypothetical protein